MSEMHSRHEASECTKHLPSAKCDFNDISTETTDPKKKNVSSSYDTSTPWLISFVRFDVMRGVTAMDHDSSPPPRLNIFSARIRQSVRQIFICPVLAYFLILFS